jgi:hypothetical protein
MLSKEKKFIFIHIPKTGGSSIRNSLIEYFDLRKNIAHEPQSKYLNRLGNSYYDYFQFTFVRNPWDRFCSAYHYLKAGGRCQNDIDASNALKLNQLSFKEFLVNYKGYLWGHFGPQHRYIDFDFKHVTILKYENLQEGFDFICDKIKINRKTLPCINKSDHDHYSSYYDDETQQIIAEKYAKDIEYFGYKFGEN